MLRCAGIVKGPHPFHEENHPLVPLSTLEAYCSNDSAAVRLQPRVGAPDTSKAAEAEEAAMFGAAPLCVVGH